MSGILSEVERVRTLVGGNIISASLDKILIGICDLLNQQQIEIKMLREDLEARPSKADIETVLRLTANKVSEIEEKYNDDHDEFEKAFNSVKRQVGNLEKKIQANAQQTDQVVHEFMKKTSDDVNGMSLVHTQVSNDLHTRMTKVEESGAQLNSEFDVVREMLQQVGISTLQKLGARLENIDRSIAKVHDENQTFASELSTIRSDLARRDLSLRKAVDRDLVLVQNNVRELQDAVFVNPGDKEKGFDITMSDKFDEDLMPIIRSVHRNSRRLDGLNEMISGMRIECENLADTMETSHEVLKQFNHCIYDTGLDLKDLKADFTTKLKCVQDWITFSAQMAESMWQVLAKMQDSHSHLAASTAAALETAQKALTTVLPSRVPITNTLDEVVLESRTNSENLLKIRSGHDISSNLVTVTTGISALHDESTLRRTKPQPVPDFQKKMPHFGSSPIIEDALKPIPAAPTKNDPVVIRSIEEMRVKTQTLEDQIHDFTDSITQRMDSLASDVKSKMGTKEADRALEQIRRTMEKLQRNVDSLAPPLDLFYPEPRPKSAADPTMNLSVSGVASRPRRAERKATTPKPKLAKRPVSAGPRSQLSRLASSNVSSPRQ